MSDEEGTEQSPSKFRPVRNAYELAQVKRQPGDVEVLFKELDHPERKQKLKTHFKLKNMARASRVNSPKKD